MVVNEAVLKLASKAYEEGTNETDPTKKLHCFKKAKQIADKRVPDLTPELEQLSSNIQQSIEPPAATESSIYVTSHK